MDNMKTLFTLLASLLCMISLSAQEIKLENAQELMNDLTARTKMVLDLNDEPCALIKVQIPTEEELTFEGNIIQVEQTPGEYLVYIPEGTKRIRVKHPQCIPFVVDFPNNGLTIKGKSTYSIVLVLPSSVSKPEPIKGFNKVWKEELVSNKQLKNINGEPLSLTITRFVRIDYDAVESSKEQGFCTVKTLAVLKLGKKDAGRGSSQWIGSWKHQKGVVTFERSMMPQYFGIPTEYSDMGQFQNKDISKLSAKELRAYFDALNNSVTLFDGKEEKEINDYIKKLSKVDSISFKWEDVLVEGEKIVFLQDGDFCTMEPSSLDEMSSASIM